MAGPKKSLGQHWLKDRDVLAGIADEAGIAGTDTVLEIGPGLGTLTSELLRRADKVVAVELDGEFIDDLARDHLAVLVLALATFHFVADQRLDLDDLAGLGGGGHANSGRWRCHGFQSLANDLADVRGTGELAWATSRRSRRS